MLVIDKRMTRVRNNIFNFYIKMRIKPTRGKFECISFEICRRSLGIRNRDKGVTGSWPYVGVDYGKALVAGKMVRIVIIGMDAGGIDDASVNFQRRQEECYWSFKNSLTWPGKSE